MSTQPGAVNIDRRQIFLVSGETMEKVSAASYLQTGREARAKGKLLTTGAEYDRLVRIAKRLTRNVGVFREDSQHWNWEVMLIDEPTVNASCMPGGKITFYTGIIRKLRLNDDEIAAVMGHEIAHALREHGRERATQAITQGLLTTVVASAAKANDSQVAIANAATQYLVTLPNSREHESEADKIGLELSARAGYDPHGAITLWQKMDANESGKTPAEFLSTHPANKNRINNMTELLSTVTPLYAAALAQNGKNVPVAEPTRTPSSVTSKNPPPSAKSGATTNASAKFKDFTGAQCTTAESGLITKVGVSTTFGGYKGMSEVTGRASNGDQLGPAYMKTAYLKKQNLKVGDRVCVDSLNDND